VREVELEMALEVRQSATTVSLLGSGKLKVVWWAGVSGALSARDIVAVRIITSCRRDICAPDGYMSRRGMNCKRNAEWGGATQRYTIQMSGIERRYIGRN